MQQLGWGKRGKKTGGDISDGGNIAKVSISSPHSIHPTSCITLREMSHIDAIFINRLMIFLFWEVII